jgi:hypothetical protein
MAATRGGKSRGCLAVEAILNNVKINIAFGFPRFACQSQVKLFR